MTVDAVKTAEGLWAKEVRRRGLPTKPNKSSKTGGAA